MAWARVRRVVLTTLGAFLAVAILAWLPGYVWVRTLVRGVDRLERFVLSVAVSIALLVLTLYLGNAVFGARISAANAIWYALALAAAPAGVVVARRWHAASARYLD